MTERTKRNLALYLLSIPFLFYLINLIISYMRIELLNSFTADSPIYWAVGKGILNGLTPYKDMFETKPPGVFLVSALSFALTGEVYLTNIFCFICLVVIGITPLVFAYFTFKNSGDLKSKIIGFTFALLSGTFIMLYSQVRSGNFQVEALGSAFASVYLLIIALNMAENLKPWSIKVIAAGFFMMAAVMFKEPFLLACIASALIFIENRKQLLNYLIFPLIYGGIMGTIVLMLTGTFIPYLTIYLAHMLNRHIGVYGSPIQRALNFNKIILDISNFSIILMLFVLCLLICYLVVSSNSIKKFTYKVKNEYLLITLNLFKLFAIVFLTSFAVGMGGQYYNHHYVFAVPLYLALTLYVIKNSQKIGTLFIYALTVLLIFGFVALPMAEFNEAKLNNLNRVIREQAEYVDELCDATNQERYLYLGFNTNYFYGLTEHSPLGPSFIQDRHNFYDTENWFSKAIKKQLDEAQIIIYDSTRTSKMDAYVNNYIAQHFTETPWEEATHLAKPKSFKFKVYFRKRQ